MKTAEDATKAAPLLVWKVAKVPEGEQTLKVGACRAAAGAEVRLTKEKAEAINGGLPGALVFIGA